MNGMLVLRSRNVCRRHLLEIFGQSDACGGFADDDASEKKREEVYVLVSGNVGRQKGEVEHGGNLFFRCRQAHVLVILA